MTTILVADDSPIELKLATGLLSQRLECDVVSATNGREALDELDRRDGRIDLVLSDLRMPEVDGMELLTKIRERYPDLPVVIMTSKGSEEIAVEALQNGAAGYVPKRRLRYVLPDIVQSVLNANQSGCDHANVARRLSESRFTLELGNERSELRGVIGYVQQAVLNFGLCDHRSYARLGIALEEALMNAMVHGNLEVDSGLRRRDDAAFARLLQERRRTEPYCSRRIYVTCTLTRDEATIRVRDEGPGFDPSTIPDPTDPEHLVIPSGRGLLLMKSFMDAVEFNATGNEVTLSLPPASVELQPTAEPVPLAYG